MRRDRRRVVVEHARGTANQPQHLLPVGRGGADIIVRQRQILRQIGALLRRRAIGFHEDERFALGPRLADGEHAALLVAADGKDRVDQPLDVEPGSGNHRGCAVDKKRRVVGQQHNRHAAMAGRTFAGADMDAVRAAGAGFEQAEGYFDQVRALAFLQAVDFAGRGDIENGARELVAKRRLHRGVAALSGAG